VARERCKVNQTKFDEIADNVERIGNEIGEGIRFVRGDSLGHLLLQAADLGAFDGTLRAELAHLQKTNAPMSAVWVAVWNYLVSHHVIQSPAKGDSAGWAESCRQIAEHIRATTTDPADRPKPDPDDISKAIGIFSNDPNLSDREVARRAGIRHPSKLTRSQPYQRVKKTFAASPPPRGSKDGKTRHVEAYE